MVIPIILGRQLPPPYGWEYDLFERHGCKRAGGTCHKSYMEYFAAAKRDYNWDVPRFPLEVPSAADLEGGYIWLHHHTRMVQLVPYIDELKKVVPSDARLLIIVTLPTEEAEEALQLFGEIFGRERLIVVYLCVQNYSRARTCRTKRDFGVWYSRERERWLFGTADKTILVHGIEPEEGLEWGRGRFGDPADIEKMAAGVGNFRYRAVCLAENVWNELSCYLEQNNG